MSTITTVLSDAVLNAVKRHSQQCFERVYNNPELLLAGTPEGDALCEDLTYCTAVQRLLIVDAIIADSMPAAEALRIMHVLARIPFAIPENN